MGCLKVELLLLLKISTLHYRMSKFSFSTSVLRHFPVKRDFIKWFHVENLHNESDELDLLVARKPLV